MVDTRDMLRVLGKMQRKLSAQLRSIARRGALTNSDSSGAGQVLQMETLADDVDETEHMEPYGFTSHPPAGSEGVVLHLGGDRGHPVALNVGSRGTRVTELESGEVAVYHQNGTTLRLSNDESVSLETPQGATVTITPAGQIAVTPAGGEVVQLGAGPGLAVARQTDPVAPNAAMTTFMADVVAFLAAIAPSFNAGPPGTPVVSLGPGAVTPPIPPVPDMGTISSGGTGSTST